VVDDSERARTVDAAVAAAGRLAAPAFKTGTSCAADGRRSRHRREPGVHFDTKLAIVVRDDLPTWQKLNVTRSWRGGGRRQPPGHPGHRPALWTIREFTGWSIRESDTPPW
jgi:hypothetical protein